MALMALLISLYLIGAFITARGVNYLSNLHSSNKPSKPFVILPIIVSLLWPLFPVPLLVGLVVVVKDLINPENRNE